MDIAAVNQDEKDYLKVLGARVVQLHRARDLERISALAAGSLSSNRGSR
jgi:hypothetical protein